jgi:carbonic anhydrase
MSKQDSATTSITIDISKEAIQNTCNNKCSYNFKYANSESVVATNSGYFIQLSYDNTTDSHIQYNDKKYVVQNIQIFSPSIHLFNGLTTDAEVVVNHTSMSGAAYLHVSIPIVNSSGSRTSPLRQIIEGVASNAPSDGETTNLTIPSFNLEEIIPQTAYYVYQGDSNSILNGYNIVFGKENAISLDTSKLTSILKESGLLQSGSNLSYNERGPNTSGSSKTLDDDIYISCQPTGHSTKKVAVDNSGSKPVLKNDFSLQSPVFVFGYVFILIILVIFLANALMNYFTGNKVVMHNPFSSSSKNT